MYVQLYLMVACKIATINEGIGQKEINYTTSYMIWKGLKCNITHKQYYPKTVEQFFIVILLQMTIPYLLAIAKL